MKKKVVLELICCSFIILFVYAGLMKLMDYEKFTVQIGQSPLLTRFAGFIGWFIPAAEVIVAGALAFPRFRLAGLYSSLGLMVMFTFYIFAVLNFSHHVPCSCGGILEQLGWKEHFVFNLAFVVLAVVGIRLHTQQSTSSASGMAQISER